MGTSGTQSHRGLPPGHSQEHTSFLHNRCPGPVLACEGTGWAEVKPKAEEMQKPEPRTPLFLTFPRPRKGSHHYLIGSWAPPWGRRRAQAWASALWLGGSGPPRLPQELRFLQGTQ